jgi:hypothetical protein
MWFVVNEGGDPESEARFIVNEGGDPESEIPGR